MQSNAFAGHEHCPTDRELASTLGPAQPLWKNLVSDLKRDLKLDAEEWNTSSLKTGWSLRLQRKKRNIVYLGPRDGWFLASFILGDRAVAAARQSKLPARLLNLFTHATRYAEGTAIRIEVQHADDLDAVKLLARLKVEN